MLKTIKFLVITIGSILGFIYLFVLFYLYFNQDAMTFRASKTDKNFKYNFTGDFQEINIKSFDNINLHGLLFKSKESKGLVFYLHGNVGTVEGWGDVAEKYTNLNYDIFILDYRGYGKSEGEISSQNQVFQDIQMAYNQLKQNYPEDKVIVLGYSIGSGLAANLASNNNPKKLILIAPYYNFQDLALERYPFVPSFLIKYKIPTNEFILKIKAPITIFHGDKDQVIPHENSEKLLKNFPQKITLITLKNQDHIGIDSNLDYLSEIVKILK